jgi:hypothetical protein
MALKTNIPGGFKIFDETFTANEDLSSSQNKVVVPVPSASLKMKVGLPGAQGAFATGVLLNAPESGEEAEVRLLGEVKVSAAETFNSGVEVTVQDTDGQIEAAASGDYVIGISKEPAAEANQLVTIMLMGGYYKD